MNLTDFDSRILVVDDEMMNRKLLEASLAKLGYQVLQANNGEEALDLAFKMPLDLIILDILMPRMDGYEATRRLKEDERTRNVPVLVVSTYSDVKSRVKAFDAGADDFLAKPVDQLELKARVKSLLKVKSYNDYLIQYQKRLEDEVERRTEQLREAYDKIRFMALDTILRLSQAAEYKDEDTGMHSVRIGYYSAAIARELGLTDEEIDALLHAAPMHDIGKLGVPDRILLKPGKLEPEEWEIMKLHSQIGAKLLSGSDSDVIKLAENIALTHHERWDGTGYPAGLHEDEIPISGRIVALADVFDALLSRRPYKEPIAVDRSLQIIKDLEGTHFDKHVTEAFFDIKDEILDIRKENLGE